MGFLHLSEREPISVVKTRDDSVLKFTVFTVANVPDYLTVSGRMNNAEAVLVNPSNTAGDGSISYSAGKDYFWQ